MLYHKDIGFPKGKCIPAGTYRLEYTNHALEAAKFDRYGDVSESLPATIATQDATLVELETQGAYAVKMVYRIEFDGEVDLVLAVIPRRHAWTVKTVWLNHKKDAHRSLDRSRYAKP